MDALQMFRIGYGHARGSVDDILGALPPEQLRQRPHPRLNSIAWTILHIARNEDVVVSRFLAGCEQLFTVGGWAARLNIGHHHAGTGMTDEEVAGVTGSIDVDALGAYWEAVGERLWESVSALSPDALDEITDPEQARRVMGREYFPERLTAEAEHFAGRSKGVWLAGTILAHGLRHVGEVQTIRSLVGSPAPAG